MIKNLTGFPKKIPLINFIIPKRKMEIMKEKVVFEIASLNNFKAKIEA